MARSRADPTRPDKTTARPAATSERAADRSPNQPAVLAATIVAGIILLVGTIGPPLVGQGVFLASDAISTAYPWRAEIDPAAENVAHHGPIGDTVDGAFPTRTLFYDALGDGDLLGWNPYIVGGASLGATSSSGVLGPFPTTAFLLLPDWAAPALIKVLTSLAAAGFTFLFCRRLTVDRVPALFAGLAFAGSGFMVMWTNWPQAEVAALIPALFWAAERFLQEPRPATAAPIAVAVSAMLLGNFPAVVGYALYLLVPYVVVQVVGLRGPPFRSLLPRLVGAGAAVVGGVLLTAGMLVPFALHLREVGTEGREQTPELDLGVEAVVTSVAPKALGLSTEGAGGEWFARHNQVEGVAFVGVTCALLAVLGAALPLRAPTPRGARGVLTAGTVVLGWATFVGGDVLEALQRLPVFSDNFVGRTRSVLGFTVAVLAALGMQALMDRRAPRTRHERWWAAGVLTASAIAAVVVVARAHGVARTAGRVDVLRDGLMLPGLIGVAAVVAAAVVASRNRRSGAALALAALPVLLVVESLALALPLLPNEDRSTLYPGTPATDFLAANADGDRVAVEGLALFGNTSARFQIRSATGHTFHSPTWKAALESVDPAAFSRSETFSFLSGAPGVMASPVLDRLGVQWFAGSPETASPGRAGGATTAAGDACAQTVDLDRRGLDFDLLAGGGVRGVTVRLCEPGILPVEAALSATVAGAIGRSHPPGDLPPGQHTIAVPAEDLPASGTAPGRLTLDRAGDASLTLAASESGAPLVDPLHPVDDGLRLVYADDLRIYERTRALPRVRWAGHAEVIADEGGRLTRLASGRVPADTVVLSAEAPPGSGATGTVEVVRDDPTSVAARVDADGTGYLVVSDAVQNGWVVTVDGEARDLVDADQAGVAVAVPTGTHEVELRYRPRGQRAGVVTSGVTALALGGLWVWDARRYRRRAPETPGRAT